MSSAHDDGLYGQFYADYSTREEREVAEQELLYSVLDEAQEAADAAKANREDGDEEPATELLSFTDPHFVAGGASLYRNPFQPPRGAMPAEMIEWNRLSKLEVEGTTTPTLFGPGVPGVPEEPTSLVVQGALRNCWFIGAAAVLATKASLVKALFVSDSDVFGSRGFHTLRFFKCGLPRYVHVDDLVPCNRAGRVHYARTFEPNETWLMLAEKAYAKLHGCYENLTLGSLESGLRDMTGWPTLKHDLNDPAVEEGDVWEKLKGYTEYPGWLLALEYGLSGTPGDGVLSGHAYGVMEMVEVHADATAQFDALDVRMVRLHNPWGMAEWSGDWSKGSEQWSNYPEIARQLNRNASGGVVAPATEGEKKKSKKGKAKSEYELAADAAIEASEAAKEAASLWMSWEDVMDHFTCAYAAINVRPKEAESSGGKAKSGGSGEGGSAHRIRGRWVPGDSKSGAGGSPEHVSWPQNPQYMVEVPENDTKVAVTLSTEDTRFQSLPGDDAVPCGCIGFVVMKLTGAKVRSTKFHPLKMRAQSSGFSVASSMSGVCTLKAGRYAIVPSTFHPESEARNFVLEVFGSKALKMQEGDAVVDADRLDESDDEELGPIDGLGVEQVAPAVPDPENSGKELEALSSQAGELASLMKTLIGDIKALEERVDVLAPREPAP